MGKSGAGKSSLCNALFQGEVTPVSDVHAGPREVQRFRLNGHGHSMVITDLPGVGESRDRDAEYEALYRDILLELDLVLWLIKADDRALSVDEYFWRHILQIKTARREMVLAVVGTMKAGKSTTINAIVGQEILPTRVNDRVSSLVSDTARLAHYSADTREQLLTLSEPRKTPFFSISRACPADSRKRLCLRQPRCPCCSVPVRFRGQCSVMVVWEDGEICREIPL